MTDFVITRPYERLLWGDDEMPLGIYHFHRLKAEQLCRLHHSLKSIKYVQARLKVLADNGYLVVGRVPTEEYRSPYYYTLSNKSVELLREMGRRVPASFRAVKEIGKSYSHITHELELNEVIISAALLGKKVPDYRLHSFIHDRELGQHPYYTTWQGQRLGLVPDAFLDFRALLQDGREGQMAVLLEHDRESEWEDAIRRKVRAYINLFKAEAYKTRFKVNSITVVFTTFNGEGRRDQLRKWARLELEGESQALGLNFLFTTQPKLPDPRYIWLEPCWYTPYEDQPMSLLMGG